MQLVVTSSKENSDGVPVKVNSTDSQLLFPFTLEGRSGYSAHRVNKSTGLRCQMWALLVAQCSGIDDHTCTTLYFRVGCPSASNIWSLFLENKIASEFFWHTSFFVTSIIFYYVLLLLSENSVIFHKILNLIIVLQALISITYSYKQFWIFSWSIGTFTVMFMCTAFFNTVLIN